MKTAKEYLIAYSDYETAINAYAKQQVSAYIRAEKSVKGCDTKKFRRCYLWSSLNYGCAFCPKNNENKNKANMKRTGIIWIGCENCNSSDTIKVIFKNVGEYGEVYIHKCENCDFQYGFKYADRKIEEIKNLNKDKICEIGNKRILRIN
jgi:hypothetical protein